MPPIRKKYSKNDKAGVTFLVSRSLGSARRSQGSRKNETPICFSFNKKQEMSLFEKSK